MVKVDWYLLLERAASVVKVEEPRETGEKVKKAISCVESQGLRTPLSVVNAGWRQSRREVGQEH